MPSVRNEPDEMVAALVCRAVGKVRQRGHFARRPWRFQLDGGFGPFRHHQMGFHLRHIAQHLQQCHPKRCPGGPVIPIISFIPDLITFVRVRTLYLNYPLQLLLARSFVYVRIFNQNAERV